MHTQKQNNKPNMYAWYMGKLLFHTKTKNIFITPDLGQLNEVIVDYRKQKGPGFIADQDLLIVV